MKSFFFTILLSFSYVIVLSQDLIVTNDNDSINCKITKVKPDNIFFTFKLEDEFRSTLMPISNVKYHQFDYFQQCEVPKDKVAGYQLYNHFRFGISGGYSYQLAKVGENVPPDFVDYVNELKSGFHIGGDLTYFFAEQFGAGLKCYYFKSSNSLDNIYIDYTDGRREYGNMSDNITTSFIGPAFSTRFFNHDKRNAFLIQLSLGYMGYSNNNVIISNYKITSSTFGSALDIGYDIGLTKNLSLGFQISIITGTLLKYDLDDGTTTKIIDLEKSEYESLSRIDFSIGLRFNK